MAAEDAATASGSGGRGWSRTSRWRKTRELRATFWAATSPSTARCVQKRRTSSCVRMRGCLLPWKVMNCRIRSKSASSVRRLLCRARRVLRTRGREDLMNSLSYDLLTQPGAGGGSSPWMVLRCLRVWGVCYASQMCPKCAFGVFYCNRAAGYKLDRPDSGLILYRSRKKMETQTARFMDDRTRLYEFASEALVVCPRCSQCAFVTPVPGQHGMFADRRLLCPACAYFQEVKVQSVGASPGTDWYFHLPLWLRASCAGGELWAFNWQHLAWLERYVKATLREKRQDPEFGWSNQSAANRIPEWIKSAKNRGDILHGIARLRHEAV